LLRDSVPVIGIDNLNDYYDVSLKEARLVDLKSDPNFCFEKIDIANQPDVSRLFDQYSFGTVIHLAAQAGVRYSITNPQAYVHSNLIGFVNIMEGVRKKKPAHMLFASSSSVYGANRKVPYAETDRVDHPINLYAATKKSNELIAHAYSHLYDIPVTGLRFFTVYGPYGRPDMAISKFTEAITKGKPIEVFNNGELKRDFTYIDDIVNGILRAMKAIPEPLDDPNEWSRAKYRIFNIGNNSPVTVMRVISLLEEQIGKKAILKMLPMQPGDVYVTYADISALSDKVGYCPTTSIEEGIRQYVKWYKEFYR
jgi:UDP-glucuronate 4-epimerase